MKSFYITIVWFCLASRILALEQRGLELAAKFSKSDYETNRTRDNFAEGEGHLRYDFFVVLRNASKSSLFVLGGRGAFGGLETTTTSLGQKTYRMTYYWDIIRYIPSESDLGVVKLMQGEETQIHLAIRTNEEMDEKNITFSYAVSEKIAARFGTWSGKLETGVLRQSDVRLLKEKQRMERKKLP
jgi:hypothetical protein